MVKLLEVMNVGALHRLFNQHTAAFQKRNSILETLHKLINHRGKQAHDGKPLCATG